MANVNKVVAKLRTVHKLFIDGKFTFEEILSIREDFIDRYLADVIDQDEAMDESDKFFYDRRFWK